MNERKEGLSSYFNRRVISRVFLAGMMVDLYGCSGETGTKILRNTPVIYPAAAWYSLAGKTLNFSWEQMKDFGSKMNRIVQSRAP